jgi:hypothetical protein
MNMIVHLRQLYVMASIPNISYLTLPIFIPDSLNYIFKLLYLYSLVALTLLTRTFIMLLRATTFNFQKLKTWIE